MEKNKKMEIINSKLFNFYEHKIIIVNK